MKKICIGTALLLASGAALAAAKVAAISGKQVGPLEAMFTVTIERPTPIDMMCDATIDMGDGSSRPLKFDVGDKRTKTLQHKYAKAGTYKVVAKAAAKCEGMRETSVTVSAGGAGAAAPAKASGKTNCPKGWNVAVETVKENRYTCHPNPPSAPIKCEGGTKYFSDRGAIGCK
jgi:hypothetical protein